MPTGKMRDAHPQAMPKGTTILAAVESKPGQAGRFAAPVGAPLPKGTKALTLLRLNQECMPDSTTVVVDPYAYRVSGSLEDALAQPIKPSPWQKMKRTLFLSAGRVIAHKRPSASAATNLPITELPGIAELWPEMTVEFISDGE